MKKALIIAIPLILIAITAVGIASYNTLQKVQTLPSNSIKIIRETVTKHDTETFNRLVDVDAIVANAAKEILTEYVNDSVNTLTYSTQEVTNRYQAVLPNFINTAKIAVNDYIANGHVNLPADFVPDILIDSGVDTCVVKSFSKPVISDGVAKSLVNLYNETMKFSFELEITMQRINENEWRIVDAKGFDGYYFGIERALKMKLESLNAPIRSKIAETFDLRGFKAIVTEGDEYGFSKTLKLTLEADVLSDKPLDKIRGQVIIDGRDDRAGITPFVIDMVDAEQGLQDFEVNKILNPFVRQDVDVMRHGLHKSQIHIEITEIDFLDGTRLKQFDKLPD